MSDAKRSSKKSVDYKITVSAISSRASKSDLALTRSYPRSSRYWATKKR